MMLEWLQVGRKVVCIAQQWGKNQPLWRAQVLNFPVKNGVYTIRAVIDGYDAITYQSTIGIHLIEIHNPPIRVYNLGFAEPDFAYEGFRPLQSTEIGMEILRGLLNGDTGRPCQERVKETT